MISILVPRKIDTYEYELVYREYESIEMADRACIILSDHLETQIEMMEDEFKEARQTRYISPSDLEEFKEKRDKMFKQYWRIRSQEEVVRN